MIGAVEQAENTQKNTIITWPLTTKEEVQKGDPDPPIADNDSLLKLINSIRFIKLTAAEVHHYYRRFMN